jgi:hypothetical protein
LGRLGELLEEAIRRPEQSFSADIAGGAGDEVL